MAESSRPVSGFEVHATDTILYLTMWGFWNEAIAADYDRAVRKGLSEVTPPFAVLADISEYPPQNPAVQAVHGALMAAAKARGVCRAANLVSSVLSQNQIRRLSAESGLPTFSFYADKAKAKAWLTEGVAEARAAAPKKG